MLDRASFLRLGAASALGGLADPGAARAGAPPVLPREDDLGLLQFTATAKLVALAFADRALADAPLRAGDRRRLAALRAADARHLRRLRFSLGTDAPRTTDFAFGFDRAAFASAAAVGAQGEALEELTTGVCLSAAALGRDPGTRELLLRVMAADAGHLATYRVMRGLPAARSGLPEPLDFELAGRALDAYLEPSS